jgi:uncharacterized OsmC-like protein
MDEIREALEKATRYLTEHPDDARSTDSLATAVLESGLRVRISGPANESAVTDMVPSVGGKGSAPSPGWLFRAALASCVATLIAMRAAQLGRSVDGVKVLVDSESDDQGILGIDPSVPAGPLSVRIRVNLSANGTDAGDVSELVTWAVDHCPVVDAVRRPVRVDVHLVGKVQ